MLRSCCRLQLIRKQLRLWRIRRIRGSDARQVVRLAVAVRAAGEERAVARMRSQHRPIALLPLPEPTTRQSTAPLRQRLTVDRRMDNSVCCDDRRHTAAATLLYPGFMTSDSNKIKYCHARCCPPSWFHSGQLLSKNETHRCLQLTAPNSSDDTQFRRQHFRSRAALPHRAPSAWRHA